MAKLHLSNSLFAVSRRYRAQPQEPEGAEVEAILCVRPLLTTLLFDQRSIDAPNVLIRANNLNTQGVDRLIAEGLKHLPIGVVIVIGGRGTGKSTSTNFLFLDQFTALKEGTLALLFFRVDRTLFMAWYNHDACKVSVCSYEEAGRHINRQLVAITARIDELSRQGVELAGKDTVFLVDLDDTELPSFDVEMQGPYALVLWVTNHSAERLISTASKVSFSTIILRDPLTEAEALLAMEAMYDLQPQACAFAMRDGILLTKEEAMQRVRRRIVHVGPILRHLTGPEEQFQKDCVQRLHCGLLKEVEEVEEVARNRHKYGLYAVPKFAACVVMPVSKPHVTVPCATHFYRQAAPQHYAKLPDSEGMRWTGPMYEYQFVSEAAAAMAAELTAGPNNSV